MVGFYGKIISHGDFISRRLPEQFIQVWDNWLQQGIVASQAKLGTDWLQVYLTSPIWRFAISSGVINEQAWAGVFIPSVDKVGRQFPLTLACGVAHAQNILPWATDASDWYKRLEQLALSTLEADFVLESFNQQLQQLPDLTTHPTTGNYIPLDSLDELSNIAPKIAQAALNKPHCLWWTEGSPHVAACLFISEELPRGDGFCEMWDRP